MTGVQTCALPMYEINKCQTDDAALSSEQARINAINKFSVKFEKALSDKKNQGIDLTEQDQQMQEFVNLRKEFDFYTNADKISKDLNKLNNSKNDLISAKETFTKVKQSVLTKEVLQDKLSHAATSKEKDNISRLLRLIEKLHPPEKIEKLFAQIATKIDQIKSTAALADLYESPEIKTEKNYAYDLLNTNTKQYENDLKDIKNILTKTFGTVLTEKFLESLSHDDKQGLNKKGRKKLFAEMENKLNILNNELDQVINSNEYNKLITVVNSENSHASFINPAITMFNNQIQIDEKKEASSTIRATIDSKNNNESTTINSVSNSIDNKDSLINETSEMIHTPSVSLNAPTKPSVSVSGSTATIQTKLPEPEQKQPEPKPEHKQPEPEPKKPEPKPEIKPDPKPQNTISTSRVAELRKLFEPQKKEKENENDKKTLRRS